MMRLNCRMCIAAAALAAIAGSIAVAQPGHDAAKPKPAAMTPAKPAAAAQPGDKMPALPTGMTAEDMQACMEAGTPGPMHAFLAKGTGVWMGKQTLWMTPAADPIKTECTSTITSMMDGRFTKCEMAGDMPGMGPFNGFGIFGYDNVGKKFQCNWIDNCGTGMMQGTGELSSDQKTMTWTYNYNCPITKKPATMREVQRYTGENTMTMEMFGMDPKSGKEFKMMEIAFTRKPGTAATPSAQVTPPGEK